MFLHVDCTCRNIGLSLCILDPACFAEKSTNIGQSATKLKILETGYSALPELGEEDSGYGLYSYVILSSNSDRSSALLTEIFKPAPAVDDPAPQRSQVNMLYLPIKKENVDDFAGAVSSFRDQAKILGQRYADTFYDYETARHLLKRVCDNPVNAMRALCAAEMSRGPYLLTTGRSLGTSERAPTPFLFVDLSNIDPRAYGEFIAVFRAQVKRQDTFEGARINSLKLAMLNITLKESDWVATGQAAIANIVTFSGNTQMMVSAPGVRILETGYSSLPELGKEQPGYGLYSYIILSSNSDRSSALLSEVFKSIPSIQGTAAPKKQTNILYIPIMKEKVTDFTNKAKTLGGDNQKLGAEYASSFYDYKMARGLLNHVCNPPGDTMRELCAGDMARGPYIFAYGSPASTLEPVPAPYLFLDLSDVDPRAYGEFISAFRAQVKREDISDGARINSLRLKILNIALKASDWVSPVHKALADIVK
jgi:hypothetical protein